MFSYSHNYIEDTSRIINDGKPISVLKEYDEVNRQVTKEINTGTKTLTHKYIYNDENEVINPLLTMEVLPTSEQIIYSYDRSGNITHKITIKNEAIKESIFYKYDVSGRLINEKCYEGNNFKYDYEYKIDSNDDILEKIMYNNSGSILEREVYTYSNTIKNQLLNIKTINSNNEVIKIKEITYQETDPFRPSTYKGNTLTWASRRLETYGSNSYRYNSEGIRISKETIEGLYTYIVDQDKIITEIKPNNKKVYYHYDEQNMLVGFSYGTNEYFYIRDITGNIIHIIDKYGNIKVTYKYDAYGKVVKEKGNSELIEINSYLYKGYSYDKETSLYYCNSRYYDPEVKRFISIDDISYLDKETLSGINLYSYCYNNPINKYDPSGHFGIWALVAITAASMLIGGTAQLVSNAMAGKTGSELWRGVAGAAVGAGINVLALCLAMPTGGASLFIAAGASATAQTGVDTLETVIRGEEVDVGQTFIDLGLNFVTTLVGNYLGGKMIPTNPGWFQPQKFISVFTKSYGQKILLQTAIGAGLSGTVNFIRKNDWSKYKPIIPVPVVPLYPLF